jgi:Acetyltransferase (GNAT) domain
MDALVTGNLTAAPVDIRWSSGVPIYASKEFLESDAGEFGWIGGRDCEGKLHCFLPYSVIRKPGLRMIRFSTQTIPLHDGFSLEAEKAFLAGVVDHFRSSGADVIIPSGNAAIFRTYPDGAEAAPYGTFVQDLTKTEEALMREIRKTYRQNIRKALSVGVQIKCGPEYLDASYELVSTTLQRSGAKFKSHADFRRRIAALGESAKVFVAEHGGVIQGCMVAPFSQHTAYNCYAGSRVNPVLGSMHLLHWEAIRQFRSLGVQRFDFQGVRINPDKGSKQEGIADYKRGFGGELVQGFLWKYHLRPLKSLAYSVAIRLMTGGDIVDKEQHKLAVT